MQSNVLKDLVHGQEETFATNRLVRMFHLQYVHAINRLARNEVYLALSKVNFEEF